MPADFKFSDSQRNSRPEDNRDDGFQNLINALRPRPEIKPDAQQTQEARKLEGLYAGAAGGDYKAVNALQEELQGLRKEHDPDTYIAALNNQFRADQKTMSNFPNLRIDYEGGRVDMWSNDYSNETNTFSVDANGGISADGQRAYPPTPGSTPFAYANGVDRMEDIVKPQSPFVQNLEMLASGALDGNPLDRTKLQTELKTLEHSSPDAIDQLNDELGDTAKVSAVFDLPTFELSHSGSSLQMNVSYPYDGRQFSESSTGETRTSSQAPLTQPLYEDSALDNPDVRLRMPSIPPLDPRAPKY